MSDPNQKKSKKDDEPKIVTMASLRNRNSGMDNAMAFFAGGSEHSGQQILGPDNSRRGSSQGDDLKMAFLNAMSMRRDDDDDSEEESGHERSRMFGGQGHRLGGLGNEPELPRQPEVVATPNAAGFVPRNSEVTMYEDGFVIDGGPLIPYDDPSCNNLIETLNSGSFPSSLIPLAEPSEVNLQVHDRRHERYGAVRSGRAFTGQGYRLGSPSPETNAQPTETPQAAADAPTSFDFATAETPSTTIKFRLPNGVNIQLKVNTDITVEQLVQLLKQARPELSSEFSLISSFPRRELTDLEATLQAAGVVNSCLVIKMK